MNALAAFTEIQEAREDEEELMHVLYAKGDEDPRHRNFVNTSPRVPKGQVLKPKQPKGYPPLNE